MLAQILSTMLPVFLIAGCGALYGRYRTPDIKGLNTLNMELFVPLLVFAVLADRQAPLAEYAWLATAAARQRSPQSVLPQLPNASLFRQ